MIIELECISQYPLPEQYNGCTTSRIPMRVFQHKMFVTESLQIEEHVNSKGVKVNRYTTGKYDGEFYKFNTPYKTLRDNYFTPIIVKGLIK